MLGEPYIPECPSGWRRGLPQWEALMLLWGGVRGGVEVSPDYTSDQVAVRVIERLPSVSGSRVSFWYSRDVLGRRKYNVADYFGLVGLSLLNYSDRSVLITEGVSDYLSARMAYPGINVLGFSTLGGSRAAVSIVESLFDSIVYVCDNDYREEVNTGVRAALRMQSFFEGAGKQFRVELPPDCAGDFTEWYLSVLRQRFQR